MPVSVRESTTCVSPSEVERAGLPSSPSHGRLADRPPCRSVDRPPRTYRELSFGASLQRSSRRRAASPALRVRLRSSPRGWSSSVMGGRERQQRLIAVHRRSVITRSLGSARRAGRSFVRLGGPMCSYLALRHANPDTRRYGMPLNPQSYVCKCLVRRQRER